MALRRTGLLARLVVACGLVSPALALEPAADAPPVIRIATEGAYPPFNLIENDQPAGFEVEIGQALCAAMKARCTFVLHEWEGIIRALNAGEYDAIMASLAITKRRKERIAFSRPYYRIPAAFLVPKGSSLSAPTPEALEGRTVGVQGGSEHEAYLEARYPKTSVRPFGKLQEANLDLYADRLDAVLGDKQTLSWFLKQPEGVCCRLLGDAPVSPEHHGEGFAVGLRKADTALKARFDVAIVQIQSDGTYDRIRAKYFDFDTK